MTDGISKVRKGYCMEIRNVRDVKVDMEILNGRAMIELSLPCRPDGTGDCFQICLWDQREQLVFYGTHPVKEEDPCILQLLHPHLWQGPENPYRYRLEVYGADARPLIRMGLPIRTLTEVPGKGNFFNGQTFCPRKVYYEHANLGIDAETDQDLQGRQMRYRLSQLVKMGANMIVLREKRDKSSEGLTEESVDRESLLLQELCDEVGLLLERTEYAGTDTQSDDTLSDSTQAGVRGTSLFLPNGLPTVSYYLQKARWSSEPFVYIDHKSLQKQSNGSYRVNVYSNQKKVALFLNGRVFGFQCEGPEFVFQDIPVRRIPVLLAAEAGESRMSVTCC